MRCTRYKRVRSKFGGTVRRCASFSGRRSSRGRRRGYRRRSGMARRGSHCVRYKRVRLRGGGTARRCAKYSGGRRAGTRRYRRRGRAPFNKGRKCQAWGTAVRRGKPVRVCRSYGSQSGWRSGRGRRGAPRGHVGTYRVPGTGFSVEPTSRPSLYGRSSVGAHYRGSQEAAQRYGARQRSFLQRMLGTGG